MVTADLGQGHQDVIVASTSGAEVLDGTNGAVVAVLERGVGLQNSPLVTDDPNGTIGITLAGYNGHNQGEVEHFELAGSSGASVDGAGAWPKFHHDPQLTGDQLTRRPVRRMPRLRARALALRCVRPAQPAGRCAVPPGGPNGYYEVDKGGHVFAFGNLALCGSAGRRRAGAARGRYRRHPRRGRLLVGGPGGPGLCLW